MFYQRLVFVGVMASTFLALGVAMAKRVNQPSDRERLEKLVASGNYKDAYDAYRRLALDPKTEADRVATDLRQAVVCLQKLGRLAEADAFLDSAAAAHPGNWRLLQAAAESYLSSLEHYGAILAGKFQRGDRANNRLVGSDDRDRVRALQLLTSGLERARSDPDRPAAGRYLLTLAEAFMGNSESGGSWRLQSLTPLDVLPDFSPYGFFGVDRAGAPVEPDGSPVYYRVPESLAKASNDGQRWRWALAQSAEAHPSMLNVTRIALARFLHEQFGTQTIIGHDVPVPTEGRAADSSGALRSGHAERR